MWQWIRLPQCRRRSQSPHPPARLEVPFLVVALARLALAASRWPGFFIGRDRVLEWSQRENRLCSSLDCLRSRLLAAGARPEAARESASGGAGGREGASTAADNQEEVCQFRAGAQV